MEEKKTKIKVGERKEKKKSLAQKVFGDDNIVDDIIIPAFKEEIVDAAIGVFGMLCDTAEDIFFEKITGKSYYGRYGSRRPARASSRITRELRNRVRHEPTAAERRREDRIIRAKAIDYAYPPVSLDTIYDYEDYVSKLDECLRRFRKITVADYISIASDEESIQPEDYHFGWTNIRNISYTKELGDDGYYVYVINMPPIEELHK